MKIVAIYEAKDGKRFDKKANCEYYESIIDYVESNMSGLRSNDGVSSYVAVKQDVSEVKSAFENFMWICGEVIPSYRDFFLQVACGERHPSHAGRILSDYSKDYPVLYDTYFRFECINKESGVEYEQPYYALHEEEDMAYYGDIETFAKQAKKVRLTALVMDARCINHHIQ